MEMELGEVLKAARERIRNGWCQGSSAMYGKQRTALSTADDDCRFCLTGAIGYEARKGDASHIGRRAVTLMNSKSLALHGVCAEDFNDAKDRTIEEVIELLDVVIKEQEEKACTK